MDDDGHEETHADTDELHSTARELVYHALTLLINVPKLCREDGEEWFDHMTVIEELNQALGEDANEVWDRPGESESEKSSDSEDASE